MVKDDCKQLDLDIRQAEKTQHRSAWRSLVKLHLRRHGNKSSKSIKFGTAKTRLIGLPYNAEENMTIC